MYPGIAGVLRKAKPKLLTIEDAWPQDNEQRETELRGALLKLADQPPAHAVQKIAELEAEQSERRKWVWAKLKQAPAPRPELWVPARRARERRARSNPYGSSRRATARHGRRDRRGQAAQRGAPQGPHGR